MTWLAFRNEAIRFMPLLAFIVLLRATYSFGIDSLAVIFAISAFVLAATSAWGRPPLRIAATRLAASSALVTVMLWVMTALDQQLSFSDQPWKAAGGFLALSLLYFVTSFALGATGIALWHLVERRLVKRYGRQDSESATP